MKNNNFDEVVYGRKSIKVFDKNVKIERNEMLEMINKAVKAPSSVNMQPWRFVVVDTEKGKEILKPLIRFNTRQNETSAAMVVIFGDMRCYENAEDIFSRTVKAGFMPETVKNDILNIFVPAYTNATKKEMNDIVKIDSSLAAMQFMLVARTYGYDTNPIGGFEEDLISDALGIDSERYVPVMIIAIGKSDTEAHPTIRLDAKEITSFV